VFPGITFLEFVNLDVRDSEALLREAQRQDIHEKMHDLRMSRMAWAEVDAVRSEMALYQSQLASLDAEEGYVSATPKVTSWLDVTGGKRIGRA
jgi:CBS-domain-containing membrane protein